MKGLAFKLRPQKLMPPLDLVSLLTALAPSLVALGRHSVVCGCCDCHSPAINVTLHCPSAALSPAGYSVTWLGLVFCLGCLSGAAAVTVLRAIGGCCRRAAPTFSSTAEPPAAPRVEAIANRAQSQLAELRLRR